MINHHKVVEFHFAVNHGGSNFENSFWIIGGLFACIGIAIGIVFWIFQKDLNKDNPDYVLQFIKENKDNEQVSLAIHYNQQKWVDINTKKPLPLASTVKIIVAIEYAQQAAEGRINSQQLVSLEDLQTFISPKQMVGHMKYG